MAIFERPAGALLIDDIKVGRHIFHVYGIWPPFFGGEFIVTKAPAPLRDRGEKKSTQDDSLVFDVRYVGHEIEVMHFASDGNLERPSYNNNYWFKTKPEAKAAVAHLRSEWEKRPELIAEEQERCELDKLADRECYYDYDYD